MTEPTDALAPCPFCGSAASLHNDTDSPCWFVGCSNSACPIEPHHYADTEVEAIATWNRRTPAPVGVEPAAETLADEALIRQLVEALEPFAYEKPAREAIAAGRARLEGKP